MYVDDEGRETATVVEAHLYEVIDELVSALEHGIKIGDQCSRGYLGEFQRKATAALLKAKEATE
jgi:hypothetical protein